MTNRKTYKIFHFRDKIINTMISKFTTFRTSELSNRKIINCPTAFINKLLNELPCRATSRK